MWYWPGIIITEISLWLWDKWGGKGPRAISVEYDPIL